MRIAQPQVIVNKLDVENAERKLKLLEYAGRKCYKSEGNSTADSYKTFLPDKIKRGHQSILEHEKATVVFIVDRGVSHEIVRHRIAAYSQESTRYCNYSKEKFGNEITVIEPFFFKGHTLDIWEAAIIEAESMYFCLLDNGASAQEARSVLPNSLKTEIVVTYNMREWRHFFSLRADTPAHPQMKQVAIPLLFYFKKMFYPLFEDIKYDEKFATDNAIHFAEILEEEFI